MDVPWHVPMECRFCEFRCDMLPLESSKTRSWTSAPGARAARWCFPAPAAGWRPASGPSDPGHPPTHHDTAWHDKYINTHLCSYIYIYIFIYIFIYIYIYIYTYMYIYTHIAYTSLSLYIYIYIHMYMCYTHISLSIHIYIYIHMYPYIYIYIYTSRISAYVIIFTGRHGRLRTCVVCIHAL